MLGQKPLRGSMDGMDETRALAVAVLLVSTLARFRDDSGQLVAANGALYCTYTYLRVSRVLGIWIWICMIAMSQATAHAHLTRGL